MATGAAGDAFGRCVFDGCISMRDMDLNQRPYHRNCSCALHKSKDGGCGKKGCGNKKISFPIRRAWSESCLVLAGSKYAGAASPSPSSSPSPVNVSIVGVDNSNWECVIRRE